MSLIRDALFPEVIVYEFGLPKFRKRVFILKYLLNRKKV